ncbi:MAG: flagellar export chaperone FliS [Chakrabartia sp.]
MKIAHPSEARAHYAQLAYAARIEAASRHELVAILYEELLLAFDLLRHALRSADRVRANAHFGRATSILHSLLAGLDLDQGGPLAQSLAQIYHSALAEIARLRLSQDADRVAALQQAFGDLSDNWARIAA